MRAYIGTLRQVLGFADVDPNPARDRRVVTEVAAHVGHSRKNLTLDTYAHVLVDDLS